MSALDRLEIEESSLNVQDDNTNTQGQTKDTFGFKWSKQDTYESDAFQKAKQDWLFERYCENNPSKLDEWLSGEKKIILDAGCGPGFSSLLFFSERLKEHDYLGVDISDSVNVAKQRFEKRNIPGDFLQMDIMELPLEDKSVDMVFSEGVLHHTDDTRKALLFLAKKLKKGGRFLFYVYRRKGPIREYTDDLVREEISDLSDEEAWEALKPLTKLGKRLGELDITIEVPEDIPYLGIEEGEIDIQRFFYWYICKMYYREEFSLEEMNHVNFDWFRPLNCHRHTPDEVEKWCSEAQLDIEHMDIQKSGISVVAQKK